MDIINNNPKLLESKSLSHAHLRGCLFGLGEKIFLVRKAHKCV